MAALRDGLSGRHVVGDSAHVVVPLGLESGNRLICPRLQGIPGLPGEALVLLEVSHPIDRILEAAQNAPVLAVPRAQLLSVVRLRGERHHSVVHR